MKTDAEIVERVREHIASYDGLPDTQGAALEIGEVRAMLRELDARNEALRAYRHLIICYRIGKQPSEGLLNRLHKAALVVTEPPARTEDTQ